jgi:periplasmic protein TonB
MSLIVKKTLMHWGPLQLSLIFHGIILFALINFNISSSRPQKILVIDFSMGNEPLLQESARPSSVSRSLRLQQNMRNSYPLAAVKQQNRTEQNPSRPPETSDAHNNSQNRPQQSAMNIDTIDMTVGYDAFSNSSSNNISHAYGLQKADIPNPSGLVNGVTTTPDKSRYLTSHFTYIKDLIHKHLIYPITAKRMGWEGKVVVSFVISSAGHAQDVKISKSSGHEILDENALRAVKTAAPFPKPPVEAQIVIPILYRLN